MFQYTLVLDTGASVEPMVEAIQAGDDLEALDLARVRLSISPELLRVVVMRGSTELGRVARQH